MVKFRLIVLFIIGFLLSPALVLACGNDYRQICPKEVPTDNCQDDCCKIKSHSAPCGDSHNGCDGKCWHSSCHSPTGPVDSFVLVQTLHFNTGFALQWLQKNVFGYTETFFKSAPKKLWLPPKIS